MRLIKITVIGPKPYVLGGHDKNNSIRTSLRYQYLDILNKYKDDNTTILGIASPLIGAEIDFAEICMEQQIDYQLYIPYTLDTKTYEYLIDDKDAYQRLFDNALELITLSEDKFSPKRFLDHKKTLITNADLVIFVNSELFPVTKELKTLASHLSKEIINIDV